MGLFSRISRDSGAPSNVPASGAEKPAERTPEPPAAPAPEPKAEEKPEVTPEVKREADVKPETRNETDAKAEARDETEAKPQATGRTEFAGASGSWPGSGEDPAQPAEADEPQAKVASESSSNGTPPDLIPPDAAPVPKRVGADEDEDEPGEVRLRAEDIIAPTPRRPHPFAPQGEDGDEERRARVISFANQKGGVAKTTTTLNLAVALAEQGHKVLCIDLDPQGNLTMSQGIDPESVEISMYDVLVEHVPITEVIHKREIDIAVASIDLAGAEIAMSTQIGRERSLQKALRAVGDDYDFVCIDTPPSLGLLTINALTASDRVIVPVQCEYLSMRGLAQLRNTLEMIRENLNPKVEIEGILPTMMDSRTVHAKEAVEILEESFGDLVFKTRIKKAVKFAEAPVRGISVLKYDPEGKAAEYYRSLAQEVLAGVKA